MSADEMDARAPKAESRPSRRHAWRKAATFDTGTLTENITYSRNKVLLSIASPIGVSVVAAVVVVIIVVVVVVAPLEVRSETCATRDRVSRCRGCDSNVQKTTRSHNIILLFTFRTHLERLIGERAGRRIVSSVAAESREHVAPRRERERERRRDKQEEREEDRHDISIGIRPRRRMRDGSLVFPPRPLPFRVTFSLRLCLPSNRALRSPATTALLPFFYTSLLVCADLFCTNIYKRSRPRPRVPFCARISDDTRDRRRRRRRAQRGPRRDEREKDVPAALSGARARECLCLPCFFPLHFIF